MKFSLYQKIWILYLISLALVLPYVYNYYIEFENLDTQAIFYGVFALMYLLFIPILLIFIYVILWLKKKQDELIKKSKEKPEKYHKMQIFKIKVLAILSILSLIAVYLFVFTNLDFNLKIIIVVCIAIMQIIIASLLFYKELKM